MAIEQETKVSGVSEGLGSNVSNLERFSYGASLFIVRFRDDAENQLIPVVVNKTVTEPIGIFILEQKQCVEDAIVKKKGKLIQLTRVGSHSRLIKKPVLNHIREEREKEIRALTHKLQVLSGDTFQPLVLSREGDEITNCETGSFTHEESAWWQYVRDRRFSLLDLPDSDFGLVATAFRLRLGWREGNAEAKEKYYEFIKSVPEERDDLLPLLRDVTKFFSKS